MQLAIFLCRLLHATRCPTAGPLLDNPPNADVSAAAVAASACSADTATPDELLLGTALPSSAASSAPAAALFSPSTMSTSDAAAITAEYRDLLLRRLAIVAITAEDLWLFHLALWLAGQHAAALYVLLPPHQCCSPVHASARYSAAALSAPSPRAPPTAIAAVCAAPAASAHAAVTPTTDPLQRAVMPRRCFPCPQLSPHPAQQLAVAPAVRDTAAAVGPQPQQQQRQPHPRAREERGHAAVDIWSASAADSTPPHRKGISHCMHTCLRPSPLSAAVLPYLSLLLASRTLQQLGMHLCNTLPRLHNLLSEQKQQTSQQERSPHERQQQQQQWLTDHQEQEKHRDTKGQRLQQRGAPSIEQQQVQQLLQREEGQQQNAEGHTKTGRGAAAATDFLASEVVGSGNPLLLNHDITFTAPHAGLRTNDDKSVVQQSSTPFEEGSSTTIAADPAAVFVDTSATVAVNACLTPQQQQDTTTAEAKREQRNQEGHRRHTIGAAASVAAVTEAVALGETCRWALANPTAVAAAEQYLLSIIYTRSNQPLLAAVAAVSFFGLASAGAFDSSDYMVQDCGTSSSDDGFASNSSSSVCSNGESSSSSIMDARGRSKKDSTSAYERTLPFCCWSSSCIYSPLLLALPTLYTVFRTLFVSWVAEPACYHSATTSQLGDAAPAHSRRYYEAIVCSRLPTRSQEHIQQRRPLQSVPSDAHFSHASPCGNVTDGAAVAVSDASTARSVVTTITGLNTGFLLLLLPCSSFAVCAAAAPALTAGAPAVVWSLPLAMSISVAYCVGSLVGSPSLLLPAFDDAAAATASVSFAAARGSFARDATAAASAARAAPSLPGAKGANSGGREKDRGQACTADSSQVAVPERTETGEAEASDMKSCCSAAVCLRGLALLDAVAAQLLLGHGEHWQVPCRRCSSNRRSSSFRRSSAQLSPAKRLLRLLQDAEECGGGARRIPRAAAESLGGYVVEATSAASIRQQLLRQASCQQEQQWLQGEATAAGKAVLFKCLGGSDEEPLDLLMPGRQMKRSDAAGGPAAFAAVENVPLNDERQNEKSGFFTAATGEAAGDDAAAATVPLTRTKAAPTEEAFLPSFVTGEMEQLAACIFWAALRAAALAKRRVSRSSRPLLRKRPPTAAAGEEEAADGGFDCWEWRSMRAAWRLGRLSAASWRRQLLLVDSSSSRSVSKLSAPYQLPDAQFSTTSVRHVFVDGAAAAAAAAVLAQEATKEERSPGNEGSNSSTGGPCVVMETTVSARGAGAGTLREAAFSVEDSAPVIRTITTREIGAAPGGREAATPTCVRKGSIDEQSFARQPHTTQISTAEVAAASEYYAALQLLLQELLLIFDKPHQQLFSPASLLCCCAAVIKACAFPSAARLGAAEQPGCSGSSCPLSPTARQRRFFLIHSGGSDLTLLQLRQVAALVLAAITAAIVCFAAAFPSVSLVFLVPRTAAYLYHEAAAGGSCTADLPPRSSSASSSSTSSSTPVKSSRNPHEIRKGTPSVAGVIESRCPPVDGAARTPAAACKNRCIFSFSRACGVGTDASFSSPLTNVLQLVVGIQLLLQQPERTDWLHQLLAHLWLAIFSLSESSCGRSRGGGSSCSTATERRKTTSSITRRESEQRVSRLGTTEYASPAAKVAAAAPVAGEAAVSEVATIIAPTGNKEDYSRTSLSRSAITKRGGGRIYLTERWMLRCLEACMVVKAFEFFLDVLRTLQGEMLRSLHVLHLLRASRVAWRQQQLLYVRGMHALPKKSEYTAAVIDEEDSSQHQQRPSLEQMFGQRQQQPGQGREMQNIEECYSNTYSCSYSAAAEEIGLLRGWLEQLCYCLSGFICTHLRPQLTRAAPAAAPLLLPLLCISRGSLHQQQQHGGSGTSFLSQLLQRLRTSAGDVHRTCACGAANTFAGSSSPALVTLLCDEVVLQALFGCAAAARLWLLLGCTHRLRWLYSQLPFLPLQQPAFPSSLGAAAVSAAELCTRNLQQKIKEEGQRSSSLQSDRLGLRSFSRHQGEADIFTGPHLNRQWQQHQQPTAQPQQQLSGQQGMRDIQPAQEAIDSVSERLRSFSEKPEGAERQAADQSEVREQLLQQQLAQAGVSMLLQERSGSAGGDHHSDRHRGNANGAAPGAEAGVSKGNAISGHLTRQQQRAAASLPAPKAAEELLQKTEGRPAVPCVLAGIFPAEKVTCVAASKVSTNPLETLGKVPSMHLPSVTSPSALLQLMWKGRYCTFCLPCSSTARASRRDMDGQQCLLFGALSVAEGFSPLGQTPWWSCLRCLIPIAAVWGPVTRACCSSSHRRCNKLPAAAAATSSDVVFGIGPLSGGSASSYALRTLHVPDGLVGEAAASSPSVCTAALLYSAAATVHATAAAAAAAEAEQTEFFSDASNAATKREYTAEALLEMEAWGRLSTTSSLSLVKEAGGSGGAFVGLAAVRRATLNSAPELQRELLSCKWLQRQQQAVQAQRRQLQQPSGISAPAQTALLANFCATGDGEEREGNSSSGEQQERTTAQLIASGVEESSCVLSMWFGRALARDAALYSYVQVNRMGSAMRMLAGASTSAAAAAAAVRVQQENERDHPPKLSADVRSLQQALQPVLPLVSSAVVLRGALATAGSAGAPTSEHVTAPFSAVAPGELATGRLWTPPAAALTVTSSPAASATLSTAAQRRVRQQGSANSTGGGQTLQMQKLPSPQIAAASGSVTSLFPYQAFASLSVLRSVFSFAGAVREHPYLPVFAAALNRQRATRPSQRSGNASVPVASAFLFALILRPYGTHARALPRAAAAVTLPVVSSPAAGAVNAVTHHHLTSSSGSARGAGRHAAQRTVIFANASTKEPEATHHTAFDGNRMTQAVVGRARAAEDMGDPRKSGDGGASETAETDMSTRRTGVGLQQRGRHSECDVAAAASSSQAAQVSTGKSREQEAEESTSENYASKTSTSFFYSDSTVRTDGPKGNARHGRSGSSRRKPVSERCAGSKGSSASSREFTSSSLRGVPSTQPSRCKRATAGAARFGYDIQVTAAVWNDQGDQLFLADTSGWVYLYTVLRGPLLPPTAGAAVATAATAAATVEASAAGSGSSSNIKDDRDRTVLVCEGKKTSATIEQLLRPAVSWKAHQGVVHEALVLDSRGTWLLTRGCGVPLHALRQNPLLVEGDPHTIASAESAAEHSKGHHLSAAEEDAKKEVEDEALDGWHFFDRIYAGEEDLPGGFVSIGAAAGGRAHVHAPRSNSTGYGDRESLLLRGARPVVLRRLTRRKDADLQRIDSSSSVSSEQEGADDGSNKTLGNRLATLGTSRSRAGLPASFEQHTRPRLCPSARGSPARLVRDVKRWTESANPSSKAQKLVAEDALGQGRCLLGDDKAEESAAEEAEPRRKQRAQSCSRIGAHGRGGSSTKVRLPNKEGVCFLEAVQERQPVHWCRDRSDLLTKLHGRLLRRLNRHSVAVRNREKGVKGINAYGTGVPGAAEDSSSGSSGDAWVGGTLPLQQWASGLLSLTSGFPASVGNSSGSSSTTASTGNTRPPPRESDKKKESAFLDWAREAMYSATGSMHTLRSDELRRANESVGPFGFAEQDDQQELAPVAGMVAHNYCHPQRSQKQIPSVGGECICLWEVWNISEGGGPRLDCVFTCDDELLDNVEQLFFPTTPRRSASLLRSHHRRAGGGNSPRAFSSSRESGSCYSSRSSTRRRPHSETVSGGGRAAAAAAAEEFFESFGSNAAAEESDQDVSGGGGSVPEWVVTPSHVPSCVAIGVLQDAVTSCCCWGCTTAYATLCTCCGSLSAKTAAVSRRAFSRSAPFSGTTVLHVSNAREEQTEMVRKGLSRRCVLYGDTSGWMHAVDLLHREEVCRWRAHPSSVVSCGVSCMAAAIPCTDRLTSLMFPASWLITASTAPAADATVRCWGLSALGGGPPFLLFEFDSPAHIPLPLRSAPSETAAAAAAAAAAAGVAAKHRLAAAGAAATVLAAAAVEAMQLGLGGTDDGTSPGVVVSSYPHKERNPTAVARQSAAAAAAVARSRVLASSSLAPTSSPLIRLLGGGGGVNERGVGAGALQRELQQAAEETALVRVDLVGPYCVASVRKDGVVVLNRL